MKFAVLTVFSLFSASVYGEVGASLVTTCKNVLNAREVHAIAREMIVAARNYAEEMDALTKTVKPKTNREKIGVLFTFLKGDYSRQKKRYDELFFGSRLPDHVSNAKSRFFIKIREMFLEKRSTIFAEFYEGLKNYTAKDLETRESWFLALEEYILDRSKGDQSGVGYKYSQKINMRFNKPKGAKELSDEGRFFLKKLNLTLELLNRGNPQYEEFERLDVIVSGPPSIYGVHGESLVLARIMLAAIESIPEQRVRSSALNLFLNAQPFGETTGETLRINRSILNVLNEAVQEVGEPIRSLRKEYIEALKEIEAAENTAIESFWNEVNSQG